MPFGCELIQPLEGNDDEIGYLPFQVISEIVRGAGVDGRRYRSKLAANGTNVLIIDPDAAEFTGSKSSE
jgi:hypothetical protein